jgi:hypothetical protein
MSFDLFDPFRRTFQATYNSYNPPGVFGGDIGEDEGTRRITPQPLAPTTYGGALGLEEQERQDFLGFQQGLEDKALGFASPFANPEMQKQLALLSPTGPFANRMRAGIRSQAASNLRSSESKIGRALGARGVSGSTEAALMAKAGQGALSERLGAENQLFQNLLGQRSALVGTGLGAETGLRGAQIGFLGGEEYPTLDPVGRYFEKEGLDLFREQLDRLNLAGEGDPSLFEEGGVEAFLSRIFSPESVMQFLTNPGAFFEGGF